MTIDNMMFRVEEVRRVAAIDSTREIILWFKGEAFDDAITIKVGTEKEYKAKLTVLKKHFS